MENKQTTIETKSTTQCSVATAAVSVIDADSRPSTSTAVLFGAGEVEDRPTTSVQALQALCHTPTAADSSKVNDNKDVNKDNQTEKTIEHILMEIENKNAAPALVLLSHNKQISTATAHNQTECNRIKDTNKSAGHGEGDNSGDVDSSVGAAAQKNDTPYATVDAARGTVHFNNNVDLTEDTFSTTSSSIPSIGSIVCRICHNAENPERLVSPCLCKGSLTYVHVYCLERWISTSRNTTCELCQFTYNTEQTLRYTCIQSLRMWYSRSMSRRALQEDCQMFSLLTLVAFGIIGTLLVGIQHFIIEGRAIGLSKFWTKSWLIFFLVTTVFVYFMNVYMIMRSQLTPWYRWWQSARDIKLTLENRNPLPRRLHIKRRTSMVTMYSSEHSLSLSNEHPSQTISTAEQQQQPPQQIQVAEPQIAEQSIMITNEAAATAANAN